MKKYVLLIALTLAALTSFANYASHALAPDEDFNAGARRGAAGGGGDDDEDDLPRGRRIYTISGFPGFFGGSGGWAYAPHSSSGTVVARHPDDRDAGGV